MDYICLYIQHRDKQPSKAVFFITNLGKEGIIIKWPWFEEFNPTINWQHGKVFGRTQLKTPAALTKEQLDLRL